MREKLMRLVCDALEDGCVGHCQYPHCYRVKNVADILIENDVVPVVRCKDCYLYTKSKECSGGWCRENSVWMKEDDFCSYGERKDNAQERND